MIYEQEPLPVILAVDPGTVSGWAVLTPDDGRRKYKLHAYGRVKRTKGPLCAKVLQRCCELAIGRRVRLVLEDQYIPSDVKGGGGTQIQLVINRARWQVAAEFFSKVDLMPVKPQKWQSKMLGVGFGVKRDRRKALAMSCAQGTFERSSFTADEADAICMALNEARMQLTHIDRDDYPTSEVVL